MEIRAFKKHLNNKAGFTKDQTDKITNVNGIFTRFARLETSNLDKRFILLKFLFTQLLCLFPSKKVQRFWNTIVFVVRFSYSYSYCSFFFFKSVQSCRNTKGGGIIRNLQNYKGLQKKNLHFLHFISLSLYSFFQLSSILQEKNTFPNTAS